MIKVGNFSLLVSQVDAVVVENWVLSNEAAKLILGHARSVGVDHELLEVKLLWELA
tara:strand:+ start:368 stop:535 length:168 start_codon:yes stop_codon:yes gene_type:complete